MPAQALRLSMVKMGMNQAIISLVINRMPGTSGLKIAGDNLDLQNRKHEPDIFSGQPMGRDKWLSQFNIPDENALAEISRLLCPNKESKSIFE
jgi:hypothetical protein